MKAKRDRRILVLLRVLLFVIGGAIGILIAWQIQQALGINYSVVIFYLCYGAGILLIGGVLALSAELFLSLARSLATALKNKMSAVSAFDVTGLVIGLVFGMVSALLVELLLQNIMSILALRVVIDIVLGLLVATVASYNCSKWLSSSDTGLDESETTKNKIATKGYILTRGALRADKITTLCRDWLDGNIFVISTLYESLSQEAKGEEKSKECENFNELYTQGIVKIISVATPFNELETTISTAYSKKLKVICSKNDKLDIINTTSLSLLIIEQL